MGIFDNAVSVVIGNKIVDSITTSDNGVIYQREEHTRLSIDVPLNLTYSDAFSITGHLTTANGTGISGEEVVLKVDGSVMDSTTTTNNGAYSFTQTPVSTGNHNFQVVYAGSNSYGSSESSRVTRDINKETSVLTATLNKSKYDIGDNVVITAHLTDDEGNEISNPQEIVHLKINYNGTWENIGLMNFIANNTITIPYQDGYNSTWQLKHEETTNYAESSINIPLNIVTPTLISSSATDSIITSGDSTTVTATLLDQDGDAIPNRSMSYVVKHGSTTLDSGSATTNSSGQVSVSYTGTSVGAVDFEFKYGSLLQETFVIYDSILYDLMTSDTTSDYYYNNTGGTSLAFSNGSFILTGGTNNRYFQLGSNTGVMSNLARFKGKKLTLEVDVKSITGKARVSVYEYGGGAFIQQKDSEYSNEDVLTVTTDNAISDSITRLYLRVQVQNTDDTVTMNNFRVLGA